MQAISDLSFVVRSSLPCTRWGYKILRVVHFGKCEAELLVDNIIDISTELVLRYVYLQCAFIRVIIVDTISRWIDKVRVASVLASMIAW